MSNKKDRECRIGEYHVGDDGPLYNKNEKVKNNTPSFSEVVHVDDRTIGTKETED